jgi:hypothetical protein
MKGISNVIQQFITNEAPFFIILDGRKDCVGKNNKLEDVEDSANRLQAFLSTFDNDSKSKYTIYCFEKLPTGKLNGKVRDVINMGEHDYIINFAPYQPKEITGVDDNKEYQRALWKLEREQKEKEQTARLERIETLLLQRQIEEGAEDDEEIADQAEPKSVIGALMDNPQIQGALAGAVTAWLSKIMMPAGQPYAVAGVPEVTDTDADQDRIDAAIEILAAYDNKLADHLEKLAVMAQTDTDKFNFLLTML